MLLVSLRVGDSCGAADGALSLTAQPRAEGGLVIQTTLVLSPITGIAYLIVIAHLGIATGRTQGLDFAAGRAGIKASRGWSSLRALLHQHGRGRHDAQAILIHDSFNPVTLEQSFRLSLWKFRLLLPLPRSVLANFCPRRRARRVLGFSRRTRLRARLSRSSSSAATSNATPALPRPLRRARLFALRRARVSRLKVVSLFSCWR